MDSNGNIKVLLILSKGDIFGEITMIQDDYDLVNTKTHTKTKICKISKETFYNSLMENPKLYKSILLMITTKFRTLMYQIHDTIYLNTKDQLYYLLKRLSVQHGKPVENGQEISLIFTQEELANMIGSTRSTVSKLLKILEIEEKIEKVGKKIILISR